MKFKQLLWSLPLALASYFPINAIAAETPKQTELARDSVFIEESAETKDNIDTFYHFLMFANEKGPYMKALFTDADAKDSTSFGLRQNFDFGVFNGNAELIGFEDSTENHGIGVNARGNVNKNLGFGSALEKTIQNSNPTLMSNVHTNANFSNVDSILGVTNQEDKTKLTASLGYTFNINYFGVGLTKNTVDGDWFATAVAGRHFKDKGQDFGYRLYGKQDSDKNYTLDFLASTKTAISKGTIAAMVTQDNGLHDPKLFTNRFDSSYYLWERTTPGGIALNAGYSDVNDNKSVSVNTAYRFPTKISPMILAGYTRKEDASGKVTESATGSIGVTDSSGNYLTFTATGTDNQKPNFSAVAGFGF